MRVKIKTYKEDKKMKRIYEQVAVKIVLLNVDVITSSSNVQQFYGSDNVVSWWGMEGFENEN